MKSNKKKNYPNKEKLTVENLRGFKGFETIQEEEATHIVNSINQFAAIIADNILNNKAYEEN